MIEETQASQRRIGLRPPSSPIYAGALSFLQSDTRLEQIPRERKRREKNLDHMYKFGILPKVLMT